MLFIGIFNSLAFANELVVEGNTIKEVSTVTTTLTLWQTEMTDEMKLVPFSCLKQARENGQATCKPSEGIIERFEWGFPIIVKRKNYTVSFVENEYKLSPSTTYSGNWSVTIAWILIPFFAILFIHFINGREKISRKKLLIFDMTIILSVLVGVLAGVLAGPSGGYVGGLVGLFAGWFTGGFAGLFISGTAGVLVTIFSSTFTGAFATNGYSFWECVERAMIPEYLLFLVVTFIIGFIIREITFWYCNRKSTCNTSE